MFIKSYNATSALKSSSIILKEFLFVHYHFFSYVWSLSNLKRPKTIFFFFLDLRKKTDSLLQDTYLGPASGAAAALQ